MITRLVKMHFKSEETADFLDYFETIKHKIRNQAGLIDLKIYQDIACPDVVFTQSLWESEQDLNNYRESALFGQVWPNTKKRFAKNPEAWSLTLI